MIEIAPKFLAEEEYKLMSKQNAAILTQPLGPLLAITPFTSPFWIPFRTVLSPMILGSSILLKHSATTPLCSLALNRLFNDAGFDQGEF